MKLSESDYKNLAKIGASPADFKQIEARISHIRFYSLNGDKKSISRHDAIGILGELEFWSGVYRCSFHLTALRISTKGEKVLFEC